MPYLLKFATVVSLDPPLVERADLRVVADRVVERGFELAPREDDEVIDLNGKLVMPGMVCAHTHLYSSLARGMPAPPRAPSNFKEILEFIWWRLDRALDEETIYWSAIAGALDAARSGTTCLFDHHASPSHITGSLEIIREAIEKVGVRAVLCYEVTDRGGIRERKQGLKENRDFLSWVHGATAQGAHANPTLFRAMVGAHASFTMSDESLEACAGLMGEFDVGLHIHAAEDICDVEDARARYEMGVVERLATHGALNPKTILAHCTHLDDPEIDIARKYGAWIAHNPRSNMNNRVGYARVGMFRELMVLGTDGIGADMFEEARTAFFRNRDARAELDASGWLRVLANNQRLGSAAYRFDICSLRAGSVADLIVLDYQSPTPLSAENLAWHLMFAMSSASVESVMVSGRFVIRDRHFALDDRDLCEKARAAAEKLWVRIRSF